MKARDRFTLEREVGRRNRPISSYLIQMREGKEHRRVVGERLIVSNTDEVVEPDEKLTNKG
jgi:hypothetical protein